MRYADEASPGGVYMNERKQIPVGTSDFKEIISDYYYVDKSLLIKDILDIKSKVLLISRPRRFGKTSNMSMLKCFFEKTEEDTAFYFKDLKIWQQGEDYRKNQGKHPVIFLTLKDIKCNSWEVTLRKISNVIQKAFAYFEQDLFSGKLNEYENNYCHRILNRAGDQADYEESLSNLTEFLYKIYGEKPILLIDEYDIPIQQGYMKGFYDDVTTFMRNWLSGGLKDNENLEFAVLTGILRVAKESIFSGLNNLEVFTILDEPFSQYFGFTQEEVEKLAEDYECKEKISEIKEWYDGYYFTNFDIYNPWSVLRYVKNDCRPKAYWLGTSSNDIISQLLEETKVETQDILKELLDGKSYYTDIDSNIVYPEIFQSANTIFSFLVMTGYLKAKKHYLYETKYDYELSIPNKEISIAYSSEIIRRMTKEDRKFSNYINGFMRAVYEGDAEEIDRLLKQIAKYSISYYDAEESFYHGWMLSLTGLFLDTHYISSNRETGDGRADLLLEPKSKRYPGVIFEFKILRGEKEEGKILEEKLNVLARKAYKQIQEMNYEAELKKRNVDKIYKYGVAFYKKTLSVYGGIEV